MSMGQIDLVKGGPETRSREDLEADRRMTRRMLLRAVAFKAISLAWPPMASTKKKSGCEGVAPVSGGVAGMSWRRNPQPRRQALLGAIFR